MNKKRRLMTGSVHQRDAATGITPGLRWSVIGAVAALFVLIVFGGVVQVLEAGAACPDWPTCMGVWTLPTGGHAQLVYAHRLSTIIAGLAIAWSLALAWKRSVAVPHLRALLSIAAGVMVAQVFLGAIVSRQTNAGAGEWLSLAHLGLSLLVFGVVLLAAGLVLYQPNAPQAGKRLRLTYASPFARLTLVTFVSLAILLLSGALVNATGSAAACPGWPLCGSNGLPQTGLGWISLGHRLVVLISAGLVGALFWQGWRTQRHQPVILSATTAVGVLFFAQALLGSQMVGGSPLYLLVIHQATAVAVWGSLALLVAATGAAQLTQAAEEQAAQIWRGRRRFALDLLQLTKPIVVALLLVTTYAGMVIGAQAWPALEVTFWTLVGGFLAAGGSGAINQFIDRADDQRMQRTEKRPIPSGRLAPAEGLAFGLGIALASFFILVAFVNLLAALLSLAGIFYYVVLYSLLLKKTTVQNIVIGGGAGAIPPLVGWAAATGSLNIPSLFLFAVIFMWTPPHFWALALVRRKDYARAGVPMLPVVRGERETRWQILVYTIELVALTMFLPLFGLGGGIYLLGAAVLGAWLLLAAWKVWKQAGNKVAWKMYRYSSMYLAFLFVVLMVDALL